MLDSATKRRIDTARDTLVGKVPDPKSQVEQITIALIYKFMDDMDAQAEELGGKRKFFAGDFERYGWAKLMRSGLGGHETLNLYAEAIAKMPENPGIPPLFRDIFKNAYLPYRDPETLRGFLKIIDEFEYDHSERLGDAFEYLLSVLGSQGDAGQFRTPRHIIDFIVAIVDPKKHETVLDPACGTAGFLISAYKHILKNNSKLLTTNDELKSVTPNSQFVINLTPDERKKLADNFRGYDISPDMVRLSLVNMYLHGFTDPHVFEYDTLTSQDRWNEMADVILANPPFMSPKGGIKPHNRFSVPCKRCEVLFVDYMAEHLTPGGRAGIIVHEGIIFRSQTAYKALRKMLVEQYLVAVISLPAGVFNPYAGVKTSILILDKSLAKQSDTVGFFKVENDGFNLGAQRRPIDKNDLPQVLAEINEYLRRLRAQESVLPPLPLGEGRGEGSFTPTRGLIVAKEKIAANGDYNLSGERYRGNVARASVFPYVTLEAVADIDWGNTDLTKDAYVADGRYLAVSAAGGDGRIGHAEHRLGTLVLSAIGANCGRMFFPEEDFTAIKNTITITSRPGVIEPLYLYHLLSMSSLPKRGGGQPFISKGDVLAFEIPLPPLEVQKEIVAEIEAYQKVIDGARAVLDHYRPHIPINPDWPMVELGELCELARGVTYSKGDEVNDNGHKILRANNINNAHNTLDLSDIKLISPTLSLSEDKRLRRGDIFICLASGSKDHIGKVAYIDADTDFYFGGFMGAVRANSERVLPRFLFHSLTADRFNSFLRLRIAGANINNLNGKILGQYAIPLPPLSEQEKIVSEIEAEQRLVEGNRQLIERMEQKIAATLARIWGEGITN
ncbi:MAG: N-6 DNA methylase [Armatimonadetes bacterium]|nr:N-6 DNA methylase [Armatimonadota bacterium]